MAWGQMFIETVKRIYKRRKDIVKFAKTILKLALSLRKLAKEIIDWWNGKKIAIIGPRMAGKNSLYSRLKGEPFPKQYIQTKGIEKVKKFTFEMPLADGRTFKLRCRRALNVGGGVDARERHWFETCDKADVIFYIVSIKDVKRSTFSPRTAKDADVCRHERIYADMKWIGENLRKLKENALVHILVNKMDLEINQNGEFDKILDELKPKIDKFEKMTKGVFGAYKDRLTGVTPTSMKDDYIFAISFPEALKAVYEAVHK